MPDPPGLGRGFVPGGVAWLLVTGFLLVGGIDSAAAGAAAPAWTEVQDRASGQTVYFNAWGGDPAINRYIEWAAEAVRERYDVRLVHVKVTDIAESVSRIMAERVAGRDDDGSVDLLWINGENFAALRRADLLWGPWTGDLPNAALIDWEGNPTTRTDATLPTEGFELPWGTSRFTLFYDDSQVPSDGQLEPWSSEALLEWIEAHPGRFTYPQPPAFLGTAFLKQMLLVLADDPGRLQRPAAGDFGEVSAPLWAWLDRAHGSMWRQGRLFPRSGPAQRELLAAGELCWMMSYNPAEASRAIREGQLPETVQAVRLRGGALANSHFLAIPYNAASKAGAMLVANFLISPEAQARKADVGVWGDPTVLDLDALAAVNAEQSRPLPRGAVAPGAPDRLLPEPHPSWTARLERAWLRRYVR